MPVDVPEELSALSPDDDIIAQQQSYAQTICDWFDQRLTRASSMTLEVKSSVQWYGMPAK